MALPLLALAGVAGYLALTRSGSVTAGQNGEDTAGESAIDTAGGDEAAGSVTSSSDAGLGTDPTAAPDDPGTTTGSASGDAPDPADADADNSAGTGAGGAAGAVGDLVFAADQGDGFDLLRRNRDGTVEVVLGGPEEDTSPSLSPDGDEIVFERNLAGVRAVFVAPVDGSSPPRRLSPEGAEAGEPVWSPDGSAIAWTTRANGNWDIAVHRVDAGTESLVVSGPSDDRSPSWSPDGTGLVFRSDRTGGGDIYTLDLTTQSLTQVTATPDRDDHPAWGGDDLIAYERWLGGDAEVYTTRLGDADDGDLRLTRHAGFDGWPAFSGPVLLVVTATAGSYELLADPGGEASLVHRSAGRIEQVRPVP